MVHREFTGGDMQFGKVTGSVVSTRKDEQLEGMKFLIVQRLGADLKPAGDSVVAIDGVGAGMGEVVLYVTGSSARQTERTKGRPADALIMAIVDSFDIEGRQVFSKFEGIGA